MPTRKREDSAKLLTDNTNTVNNPNMSNVEFSFNLSSTATDEQSLTAANLRASNNNNNNQSATRTKYHPPKDEGQEVDSVTSDDLGHALHSEAAAAALRAREELVEAVDFFVQWKDALIQVHPLPSSALLPLLTTSSKLLRCRDVLQNNIRTLANLAQSFAKGLLSDEHVSRLKTTSEVLQLELSMEKMRRVESTRKLTSSLGLLRRYRDEIRYIRWYRLMLKVLSREHVRTADDRVKQATSTVSTLKSTVNTWKKKCQELESLQKATSQVAIKNQTRADVLERQLKKAGKREKKLTDHLSSLTDDHASLQKAVHSLENERETDLKQKATLLRDANDEGRIKRGGELMEDVDGEWNEKKKALVNRDVAREKERREKEFTMKERMKQEEEEKRKTQQREKKAGTPLWQPGMGNSGSSSTGAGGGIDINIGNVDVTTTPVARAARASSDRRKAEENRHITTNGGDDEAECREDIDPWSMEATTPPPVYEMKIDEKQDNFTTKPLESQRTMSPVGRFILAEAETLVAVEPTKATENMQQNVQKDLQNLENVEMSNTENRETERERQGKIFKMASVDPTPMLPDVTPMYAHHQVHPPPISPSAHIIAATTTVIATATMADKPDSPVVVPVEMLAQVRQRHASEIMKKQRMHDEQVNALKARLAEAEQTVNTTKREMRQLSRQCKKKAKVRPRYNGVPSYDKGNTGRDFFSNSNDTIPQKNTGWINTHAPETETGAVAGEEHMAVAIRSNKTINASNVARFQKLADASFHQKVQRERTTHPLTQDGPSQGRRPLTTGGMMNVPISHSHHQQHQKENPSRGQAHRYYLAPDRASTDTALRVALKEDGPLRLPANFMHSTPRVTRVPLFGSGVEPWVASGGNHSVAPHRPTTTHGGGGSSGGKRRANPVNFSSRIYTRPPVA